jgi:alkaline phosphatase D
MLFQVLAAVSLATPIAPRSRGTTRLGFGSCSRVEKDQPLWPHIATAGLDAWIWGGDAIYADERHACVSFFVHRKGAELGACVSRLRDSVLGRARPAWMVRDNTHFTPARPERIERLYRAQLADAGYAAFLKDLRRGDEFADPSRIIGTWDDHDFGIDDGDRTYAFKAEARLAFARFIAASGRGGDAAAWAATSGIGSTVGEEGEGVYRAVLIGAPPRQVMVVLLDLRYFKAPWAAGSGGTMLGERQERWLQRTLRASKAQVHLIVSSLQVLATQRNFNAQAENWERFPRAREALLSTLLASGVGAPLILSGDVHFAEIARVACVGHQAGLPRPAAQRDLYEVTSSGMTHAWGGRNDSAGRAPRFGLMRRMVTAAFAHMPWRYSLAHYRFVNWLEIEIEWERGVVHARVIGVDGDAKIEQAWALHNGSTTAHQPSLAAWGGSGGSGSSSSGAPDLEWSCAPTDGEVGLLCTVTFHANHAHNLTRSP